MAYGKKMAMVLAPIVLVGALVGFWIFSLPRRHQHCIKIAGTALQNYATAHEGKFPLHTNGFGDALLLLVKEDALERGETNGDYTVQCITGPGDDGRIFKEALKTGADVVEEECSRVYVQGLSETNNSGIAILFDRKSTRGGDHFRRPWGPMVREVCMLNGSMETVREEKWAEFAKEQMELLVDAGISREAAEGYYRLK